MTIPPMSWQPIETAPRDGTPILAWAYMHDDGGPLYADRRSFMGEMPDYCVLFWRDGIGWVDWVSGSMDGPTHWQPLPEPPPFTPTKES